MKLFCVYILLAALTLQSFYRSVMAMDYQIHLPDYLAKCINKDRPELHCNGQCVLMKKVREQEKKEAQKNLVVYEYSALYFHKEQQFFNMDQHLEIDSIVHVSNYTSDYRFTYSISIFHPPLRRSSTSIA